MKSYVKVYLITVLFSGICIGFPWLLELFDITNEIEIFEWQGILSGLIALLFSCIYILRKTKGWKQRVLLILTNPAIYYVVVLVYIGISFSSESWQGFGRMNASGKIAMEHTLEETLDVLSEKEFATEVATSYNKENIIERYWITIYSEDREIETRSFDKNGRLTQYAVIEYDEMNQKTKESLYNPKKELIYYYTYEYDESGNLKEKTSFTASGIDEFIKRYRYDDQNRMVYKANDVGRGMTQEVYYTSTYLYDEQGMLIREDIFATGAPYAYILYAYNGENLIRQDKYYVGTDEDPYCEGIEYSYDSEGRLQTRIIYDKSHNRTGYVTYEYR